LRAGAGKVDRVGADPAADLEHALPLPPIEFDERGNVRLNEVLPGLDLVEVLLRADRLIRMSDIAGARIPVLLDGLDRRFHRRLRQLSSKRYSQPDTTGPGCSCRRVAAPECRR